MIEIKAPEYLTLDRYDPINKYPSVFLAGSIEMGAAEKWQDQLTQKLSDLDCIVFNPRRDDWDSSWIQSVNDPKFFEQVLWEQQALEQSDIIALYFDPNTKSPISLLEFGEFAKSGKMIVCCPEGFWRKGNIEVMCMLNNIHLVENKEVFFSLVFNNVASLQQPIDEQ